MTYHPGPAKRCIAPVEIREGDLVAFLEGEASATVARHIALCPACAAEVAALRSVESLLGRALRPDLQPVSSFKAPVKFGQTIKRPSSAASPALWSGLAPLGGFSGALALATVVVIFGLLAGWVYRLSDWEPGSASDTAPQLVAATGAETNAPLVIPEAVLTEAASPDVDQRFISQQQQSQTVSSPQVIVENLARLGRGSAFPAGERHAITRIIDVNIADRFFDEKEGEIAPPLNLRRVFEQQLQEQPDEFMMRLDRFKSKSMATAEDGTHYVVWADNRGGMTTLYAAHSSDGGQNWSENLQIDSRVGRVFQPALAVGDQGQLYLIWRSWSNIHRSAFYFAHSTDGGQSWSQAIPIETTPGRTVKPNLAVDADKGHLYVAWGSNRDTNTDIYFIHSLDRGQTWSSKVRMANIGS